MMPLITRRSSTRRAPRRPLGSSGSTGPHSSSLSQKSCFRIKVASRSEALNHNSSRSRILIEYRPLVREEQVTSSGRNKVKGLVITEAGRKWLDGEDVAPKSGATPESATAEGATPERDVTQESKITPESNLTAGAFRDSSGGKRGPSNSLVKPPSKG